MTDGTYDNLEITTKLTIDKTASAVFNSDANNEAKAIFNAPNGVAKVTLFADNGMYSTDPALLHVAGSVYTENDGFFNGSITSTSDFTHGKQSGGGAFLISHGWVGSGSQSNPTCVSPPLIKLTTTGSSIKSGGTLPSSGSMTNQPGQIFYNTSDGNLYIWTGSSWVVKEQSSSGLYDTLFLLMSDGYNAANLDIGNLTLHGNVYGNVSLATSNGSINLQTGGWLEWGTDTKLARTVATRGFNGTPSLATQNGSGSLGIHLTSGLQVDHIDSASGGGIAFFDIATFGYNMQTYFGIKGGYTSPTAGRIIFGDGTGWNLFFSRGSYASPTDVVQITDTGTMIINGYLEIMSTGLYIYPTNGTIYLGNNGGYWDTRLVRAAAGVVAINNQSGGLGVIQASQCNADHINSASGAGIYMFDHLYPNGTINIGSASAKFSNLYVVTLHQGDSIFANGWRLTEDTEKDGMLMLRPDGTVAARWN